MQRILAGNLLLTVVEIKVSGIFSSILIPGGVGI